MEKLTLAGWHALKLGPTLNDHDTDEKK